MHDTCKNTAFIKYQFYTLVFKACVNNHKGDQCYDRGELSVSEPAVELLTTNSRTILSVTNADQIKLLPHNLTSPD